MVGLTLFPLQMIRLTLAHCKIKEISPNKEDLKLPLSNDFFFCHGCISHSVLQLMAVRNISLI